MLLAPPVLDPPAIVRVVTAPAAGAAELLFTNPGDAAIAVPATIAARIERGGDARPVALVAERAASVPAHGFVRVTYRFAPPAGGGPAVLALGEGRAAFDAPATAATQLATAAAPPPVATAQPRGALVPNLAAYRPVYAVYGPGSDSAAKLQLSFQYQLFGRLDRPTGDWKEGLRVAYTQEMFWDVEQHSAPFRDVNYEPEAFYVRDFARPLLGAVASARAGFLHVSNGRGGTASRGYQVVYAEPTARFRIAGLDASIAPRLYAYVGGRDENPDIARYRGHQSIAIAIGREDGLKLAAETRYAFGSGKGAIQGELSYPMARLIGVPVYLVAQGFTGYGEDLRDYDRHQTRVRIGIGVIR